MVNVNTRPTLDHLVPEKMTAGPLFTFCQVTLSRTLPFAWLLASLSLSLPPHGLRLHNLARLQHINSWSTFLYPPIIWQNSRPNEGWIAITSCSFLYLHGTIPSLSQSCRDMLSLTTYGTTPARNQLFMYLDAELKKFIKTLLRISCLTKFLRGFHRSTTPGLGNNL